MRIILLVSTILLSGLVLFLIFQKKENYQTFDEEFQKYNQLSSILSELCDKNKSLCDDLDIKNPLARGIIFQESFLKRLNEELQRDIDNLKASLDLQTRLEIKDQQQANQLDQEFRNLFAIVKDYQGYINYFCRKYSQLCGDLNIPNPVSLKIYKDKDNKYMKDLINILKRNITKLRRGIEEVRTREAQREDILYDFEN